MIKLKDIANHLGISVSAASMALRDHEAISPETRQRVQDASERLGYRRKQKKTTGNIAFILCDRHFDNGNSYWGLQGIFEAAQENHLQPINFSISLKDLHNGSFPLLLKNEIDGIIIAGLYDEKAHTQLKRLKIPIVVLGNYQLGNEPWSSCEIDIPQGMRMMVGHLVSLGHRRLGLLLGDDPETFYRKRLQQSFMEATSELGISKAEITFENKSNPDLISNTLKGEDRPTAFIAEGSTVPIYTACHSLGLKIPQDISVITLGSSDQMIPPLAMLQCDSREIGRGAVEKLIRMIKNPRAVLTRELYPIYLTPASSIGPAPKP